uniref:Uncharacterized protein n=1 Tax=Timema monikensis TaxID=170555 RepID=A0A7R9HP50_9NEOP|nr:unnamed protein product [Timema monikensis]
MFLLGENDQGMFLLGENDQVMFLLVENDQGMFLQAENNQGMFLLVENDQGMFLLVENDQVMFLLVENDQGMFLLGENDQGMFLLGENDQGMFLLVENDQGMFLLVENDQGMFLLVENDQGMFLLVENDQGMFLLGENDQGMFLLCLQNAEMAQRTHETPTALQFQNTAPLQFFTELAAKFDKDMEALRMEIENAEKHINCLSHARAITPQELTAAMRMLHDTFVALAGRLQTVHNAVEVQKERFLDLRRYFLKDTSDVFGSHTKPSVEKVRPPPGVTPGPSPFSALGSQTGYGLIFSTPLDSQNINSLGWSGVANPQPSFNLGGTLSGSGAFSPMKTPLITDTSSFQLQKPPLGNKRNKR